MNIWQVIQFSAAASLVAAVILGVKLLFHDKLDARWHYLIWLVLLVRMLVPVQVDVIRTPVSLFETVPVLAWLQMCELTVHKAGMDGLMDILFGIYLAGAAAFLCYDLICCLFLRVGIALAKEDRGQQGRKRRRRLRRASEPVCRRVEHVAQKYGLRACGKICVQAVPTPYVCGLWKTALVLTEEMASRLEQREEEMASRLEPLEMGTAGHKAPLDPDEAVIVHELLHRKYRDVLVNLLLHLVRAVNWFNPFLWYVTGVVQNDGEALCDQRVLERLGSGAEHGRGYEKEYGMLLIHMAEGKERNPAKAGTSNMANSFRNMKIRIRRIADFKRVPPGIGFVTLCITLMCWNEGSFTDLNVGNVFFQSEAPSGLVYGNGFDGASGQETQPLEKLSMEYKMSADYLRYSGSADLTGHLVGIVILEEGADQEEYADCFAAVEQGVGKNGGSFLDGAYYNVKGSELMESGRIMLDYGGSAPARWEGAKSRSRHVWVYLDRECVEEFDTVME